MRKIFISLLLLTAMLAMNGQVEFRKVLSSEEMDLVWADASKMNMSVLVDIYASWCGPCKWMDANVFALEAAGEYINNEFISVKLDGESEFGRVFAVKNGLSAYPSLFLFNSEQKLMNMVVGAKPWEELQDAIELTLEYFPVLEVMQNKFESGLLKREEYPRFVKALRKMGKDDYGNAVASRYMKEFVEGDTRTDEDLQVLAYYTNQQTTNWSNLIASISNLKRALGDDIENFIDFAVTKAIESAVENSDIEYLKKINIILPELSEGTSLNPAEMETRSYIYYYHYSGLIDEMIAYIDDEYKERTGDHVWLFDAAADAVFLDPHNIPVAEKGLDWFQKCIDIKETQEYYYHLALCEYFTGTPGKTVITLKKSLDFTDDQEVIKTTLSIIKQVEDEIAAQ